MGCHLAGLKAGQLHTETNVYLQGSTCAFVELTGAQVEGQFDLSNAVFLGREEPKATLEMSGISVGSDAFFRGTTVTGLTNMIGARIEGQLDLRKATLNCRGRKALRASELKIGEDMFFVEGFFADGAVDLTGAKIGGSLDFGNAKFHHSGNAPALDLARAHVEQNLVFGDGFTAEGAVLLAGATVNGNVDAKGAQFLHPSDTAIDARGLHARDVNFTTASSPTETDRNGFRAVGKVILADSVIKGTLDCRGGSISCPRSNEAALDARGVKITRDLRLSKGFTATGTVNLTGAKIGGEADLSDGSFKNADRCAISAQQLTVRTCLLLEDKFRADGLVDLRAATVGQLKVGGQVHLPELDALVLDGLKAAQDVEFHEGLVVEGTLRMRAARIGSDLRIIKPKLSRGRAGVALDLEGTTVTGTLELRADSAVGGQVDLQQASVGLLDDDLTFWPEAKTLLADFTYTSLSDFDTRSVGTRIDWLKGSAYSAQIYEQLAAVYRAAGRADAARNVMYEGQKERPRQGWPEQIWSRLLRITIGYGYHPERVLWLLAVFEIFGTVFFSIRRDELKPSETLVVAYGSDTDGALKHLQPALYTLDLLLPVVSFGQRTLWLTLGATSWVATFLMVLGWVLGAILVYGITIAYQRRSS
ncbi:hypothetical protein ABH931_007440 [Streptacidiphilus sp. MAP12-33]|uniref:hypothetical protein n=1 Tax=Streptacidiphilus sp. MAP12-33 TaxID=3156266 RepID=UPI003511A740